MELRSNSLRAVWDSQYIFQWNDFLHGVSPQVDAQIHNKPESHTEPNNLVQ